MAGNYFKDIHAVEEKSISELISLLEAGTITSEELVLAYLERIAKFDKAGPCLNAIREINPDALALARVRDAQRKKGEILGPLHGIPVVVKDNIDSGANFAACGIGTETSGSIIMPATLASCVGIKPSIGLISRTGIIPLAFTQDTAGPICRTVADAALLLEVLVGEDPSDPIEQASKARRAPVLE